MGELQRGRWKSIIVPLPAIIQGLPGEVLQNPLQQVRPYPLIWIPPLLGEGTRAQET